MALHYNILPGEMPLDVFAEHRYKYIIEVTDDGMVILFKTCSVCGYDYCVKVSKSQFIAWIEAGGQADEVEGYFPNLSREMYCFIINGYTPKEWKNIFADSEEVEQ